MTKRVPVQDPYKKIPKKNFSQRNELGDGTDTYYYMEPDAETNSERLRPTNADPRSTKYQNKIYVTTLNQIVMKTTDTKFLACRGVVPGKTT